METCNDHNLIVDGARQAMARLLSGEGNGKNITSIAFGTSGAVPTPGDTVVTSPFVKPLTGFAYSVTEQVESFEIPDDGKCVEFQWHLLPSEANGKAIREFGLLCADGTLFARRTRPAPINKESDIAIEGQWIIIF